LIFNLFEENVKMIKKNITQNVFPNPSNKLNIKNSLMYEYQFMNNHNEDTVSTNCKSKKKIQLKHKTITDMTLEEFCLYNNDLKFNR
jgi:hypothetical protein